MLVDGDSRLTPGLRDHLAGCTGCRQLAETVASLDQLGGQQRRMDLSPDTISQTRLLAASLLAGQRATVDRPVFSPVSILRFLSQPAFTALAAASILVAVGLLAWRPGSAASGNETTSMTAREIAAIESGIGQLAGSLDSSLKGFRERYREIESIGTVEAMGASLKADIVSCSMDIRVELSNSGGDGDDRT